MALPETLSSIRRTGRRRRRALAAAALVGLVVSALGSASCASSGAEDGDGAPTPPSTAAPAATSTSRVTGSEPTTSVAGSTVRPTVAIVGDSITEMGEDTLPEELSDRWDLRVDGRSGYTVDQQRPAAIALADGEPDRMIVNLGTNDVLRSRSVDELTADLRGLLAELRGVPCLYVVNVAENLFERGRSFTEPAVAANAAIASVAVDAGAVLVDWAAEVRAYEAGDQPDGPILYDGIHPSVEGQERLAALYDGALGRCPG